MPDEQMRPVESDAQRPLWRRPWRAPPFDAAKHHGNAALYQCALFNARDYG